LQSFICNCSMQSSYSNVVHKVMSSIYDYSDEGFRIKQQLAWLNYNMALSSIKKGACIECIPCSLPSGPLKFVRTLMGRKMEIGEG